MKIGIDISQIVYQGTGVANYTKNLVKNLLKIDKENEYVLFASSLRQKKILRRFIQNCYHATVHGSRLKTRVLSIPPTLLEFIWNRLHIILLEKLMGDVDVFHSSDWTQPPAKKAKLVTTVHDLTPWLYPETLHPKIIATHKRRMKWVKKECDLIIVDSEATKKDLIKIIGISEKKIRVIYLAVDERFRLQPRKEIERVRKKYRIAGDYILTVGTREPRKNLARVIKAHSLLVSQYPHLELVIGGKFGWGKENSKFKIQNSKFKILGFVPEEDLPALYAGAKIFVYVSLYEGFGLPVLEAMACGTPVVCSNTSSLPEIAGEAAVLVDPFKVEEIVRGVKEADQRRPQLIKKGLKRVKLFSWQKTAQETLRVYQEAANQN